MAKNNKTIKWGFRLLLAGLFIQLTACNKFLDTQPQNVTPTSNFYATAAQLNSALTGVYTILTTENLYGDAIWNTYGAPTDEAFVSSTSTLTGPQVMNFSSSNANISGTWNDLYNGINRANILLENIDKPTMDSASRATIKGQALFLRAYYYFLLVSNWSDVPMPLHSTTSPDSVYAPRVDAKIVYNQIINDMTAADSLVQTATYYGFGGRISKTTVEGILARVCLYRAGFPFTDDHATWFAQSLYWSNKVINAGIHSLNPSYKQVFVNNCQNIHDIKESMWEVEFYGTGIGNPYPQPGRLGNTNGIACTDLDLGVSYGLISTQAKLFNSYADNTLLTSRDTRRDWAITPYKLTTTNGVTSQVPWSIKVLYNRNVAKWRREYEISTNKQKNNTSINFAVLRYADVLLMKAEAENEVNNGPLQADYDAINQVRRRAYGFPVNTPNATCDLPTGLSYDAFQQAVYDERYRELCFEGLRRNDLIRWGTYISTMKSLANLVNNTAPAAFRHAALAGNNIQSKNVLFPIPINEMSLNPGIGKQNAGW
jgi:hypothetical protein